MHEELSAAITSGDRQALGTSRAADPSATRAIDAIRVSVILATAYRRDKAAVAALPATGIDLNGVEAAAVGEADRLKHLLQPKAAGATDDNAVWLPSAR